jgi:V/A-type H+-transporting ATPase subunit C
MSSLLKYSGIATKIRAMKSRLLTDEEYQEIAEVKDVSEIAGYLKNKPGYAKLLKNVNEQSMHRGQLEEIISSATYKEFDSLYCFANQGQRKFLQIYAERFEIKLLKNCMTDLFSKGEIQESSVRYQGFFDKHTMLDLNKIKLAKDMHALIESLEETNYYKPLHQIEVSERRELQDYEIVLDFFHFSRVWKNKDKILDKYDSKLIAREYGSKFDMLNIHWIYRAKHYYKMTTPGRTGMPLTRFRYNSNLLYRLRSLDSKKH